LQLPKIDSALKKVLCRIIAIIRPQLITCLSANHLTEGEDREII